MHKPDGGIKASTEYAKHLRSGTKNRHKRGSMHRIYWKEWRAKAKEDLRMRTESAIRDMQEL